MTTTSIRPEEYRRRPAPAAGRGPLSTFASFPRAIWVIFAGTVVDRVGFLVVALQPIATSLLSRFPRTPVHPTASGLTALGVALGGLAHTPPTAYAATVTVWSLGEVATGAIPAALIANLALTPARARYQGAFAWTWGLARFLALAAGTTAYTLVGPAFLWWSALALGAAAVIGIATLSLAIDRRTAGEA